MSDQVHFLNGKPLKVDRKTIKIDSLHLLDTHWPNVTVMRSCYITDPDVLALSAFTDDLEPLAAFSVNLPGTPPSPGCIWLKTWSEGKDNAVELVRLGLIEFTGRQAEAGFAVALEARLLGDLAVEVSV
jgi:hypothetical protein